MINSDYLFHLDALAMIIIIPLHVALNRPYGSDND